jgi:hypothetical protein
MYTCPILYVDPVPHLYVINITPNHGIKPEAAIIAGNYFTMASGFLGYG